MSNNVLDELEGMHQATLREVADQERAAVEVDLPVEVLTDLSATTRFSRREIVRIRDYFQHWPVNAFADLVRQASDYPAILYGPGAEALRQKYLTFRYQSAHPEDRTPGA